MLRNIFAFTNFSFVTVKKKKRKKGEREGFMFLEIGDTII